MANPFAFDDDEKPKKKKRPPVEEEDDDEEEERPKPKAKPAMVKPMAKPVKRVVEEEDDDDEEERPKPKAKPLAKPVKRVIEEEDEDDEDDEEEEERPKPKKKSSKRAVVDDDEDEDDEDEDEDRPRKNKKNIKKGKKKRSKSKNNSKMFLLIGGGAAPFLMLLVGGIGVWYFFLNDSPKIAFEKLVNAFESGDYDTAWERMDKKSQDFFANAMEYSKAGPDGAKYKDKKGKELFIAVLKDEKKQKDAFFNKEKPKVIDSSTNGDSGSVTFKTADGKTETISCVKEGGKWRVQLTSRK